jgi:hypothetical protein
MVGTFAQEHDRLLEIIPAMIPSVHHLCLDLGFVLPLPFLMRYYIVT